MLTEQHHAVEVSLFKQFVTTFIFLFKHSQKNVNFSDKLIDRNNNLYYIIM